VNENELYPELQNRRWVTFTGTATHSDYLVIAPIIHENLPGQFSYELVEDMCMMINVFLSMLN
jgi:hypothetical protein